MLFDSELLLDLDLDVCLKKNPLSPERQSPQR